MSRTPFTPAPGCRTVSVTLVNVGTLPFCSVPSFTVPDFRAPVVAAPIPDFAPPDHCVSIAMSINISTPSFRPTGVAIFSGSVGRRNKNIDSPCAGEYSMRLKLVLPCIPFSLNVAKPLVSIKSMSADTPSLKFSVVKTDCNMSLKLSLAIPCMAFNLKAVGKAGVSMQGSAVSVQDIVSMRQVAQPQTRMELKRSQCQLGVGIAMTLPCTPFSFRKLSHRLSFKDISGEWSVPPFMSFKISKLTTSCAFDHKLRLRLPKTSFDIGDLTISFKHTLTRLNASGSLLISRRRAETYTPKLTLNLPCIPFTHNTETAATVSLYTGTAAATLSLRLSQVTNTCSIVPKGHLKITFPQGFSDSKALSWFVNISTITNPAFVLGKTAGGSIGWISVAPFVCPTCSASEE